jgi:hypothetical protein
LNGKKIAPVVSLAAGICLSLLVGWQLFTSRVSDRDLLREAVREYEKSTVPSERMIFWDVFCQQAAQGYYDDAMATALLSRRDSDFEYALVTLAKIRAKNGDTQGALRVARTYANSETRDKAIEEVATTQAERGDVRRARETAMSIPDPRHKLESIAIVQASKGDLQGARETIVSIGHSNRVLDAVAGYQIQAGDFDGALKTAQEIYPANIANLLIEVDDALRERGKLSHVRELASRVEKPEVAHLFLEYHSLMKSDRENIPTIEANICEKGYFLVEKHEFSAAYALIENTKCGYSLLAIKQYVSDPAGAEQALERSSDPMDFCFGWTEFSKAAATRGNIPDALRFIDAAQRGCGEKYGYLFGAVQQVARQWTLRDKLRKVVKWARSRPTPGQRERALLGVAEALGHPHA